MDRHGGAPVIAAAVVFDRRALADNVADDDELIRDVLEGFLADTPAQVDILKRAASAGDFTLLMRTGHRLKGAAALLGAEALRVVAEGIEEACRQDRHQEALGLVGPLEVEFARLSEVLRTELAA